MKVYAYHLKPGAAFQPVAQPVLKSLLVRLGSPEINTLLSPPVKLASDAVEVSLAKADPRFNQLRVTIDQGGELSEAVLPLPPG
jgi:hypothetical protein